MRRLILVAMIAGLLAPTGLRAQEVYVEDGRVILDLTEAAGVPAGASTGTSKTVSYDDYEPVEGQLGKINSADNDHNHLLNVTVYQKLEIAPHDMNKDGQITAGTGDDFKMDWATAFDRCKGTEYNGDSNWRLPTQRELQLMYIFKPALDDMIGGLPVHGTAFDPSDSAFYWSATESSGSSSWYVNFNNGDTYTNNKTTTTYRVRCVREISSSTR